MAIRYEKDSGLLSALFIFINIHYRTKKTPATGV
jgi:hypothetical protein